MIDTVLRGEDSLLYSNGSCLEFDTLVGNMKYWIYLGNLVVTDKDLVMPLDEMCCLL